MEIKGNHTKNEETIWPVKQCKHTKKLGLPPMYLKWRHEMSLKGYVQTQCKACGAWAIWKKGHVGVIK